MKKLLLLSFLVVLSMIAMSQNPYTVGYNKKGIIQKVDIVITQDAINFCDTLGAVLFSFNKKDYKEKDLKYLSLTEDIWNKWVPTEMEHDADYLIMVDARKGREREVVKRFLKSDILKNNYDFLHTFKKYEWK